MSDVTVSGMEEVNRKLAALPGKVQRRVLRPALRDAAKVVAVSVRAETPVMTGALQRSVKVRSAKRSRPRVGMRVLAMKPYVGFVEYGTKYMEGRHFMQTAFARSAKAAQQKSMQAIAAGIEREARK